jgi:exopolysaccharide biosynthesis protein
MKLATMSVFLTGSFLSLTAVANEDAQWMTLHPGVEIRQDALNDHGRAITIVLLRCDPKRATVHVVDTFHEIGSSNAFAAFSLREVAKRTGALVTVNAGSTRSYNLPSAAGLLLTNGKIVHPATLFPKDAGIFCVAGQRLAITGPSSFRSLKCQYAVQRGPILGRSALGSTASSTGQKEERYRRTVFALDNKARLLILLTDGEATLSSIATYLYSSTSLVVQSVLNMDGDRSSGLLLSGDLDYKFREIGNVDGLVASAITISK